VNVAQPGSGPTVRRILLGHQLRKLRESKGISREDAGEHVRGSVFLTVVKPVRLTHLTVALSGFVQARKDPGATTTSHPNPPSGAVDSPQYHGNGVATLFQDEQVLSGEGRLDVGKFEFKFDLLFPSQVLPSSIDVRARARLRTWWCDLAGLVLLTMAR
jgi:arrestin-related trafficking adapter 9